MLFFFKIFLIIVQTITGKDSAVMLWQFRISQSSPLKYPGCTQASFR